MPLISFDAAGTLVQVSEPVAVTYARYASGHDVQVEAAALQSAFRAVWGRLPTPLWPEGQAAPDDDRSWWRHLVEEVFAQAIGRPLPQTVIGPLFEALYTHFAQPEAWTVYDDVRPALSDLVRDHALCVLSNFDCRLRTILAGHGLDRFFQHIILSSEVGASKPHPRMFATTLRMLNAQAEMSLHVGDDPRCDIAGAQAAGWHTFPVVRPESGLDLLVEKIRAGTFWLA